MPRNPAKPRAKSPKHGAVNIVLKQGTGEPARSRYVALMSSPAAEDLLVRRFNGMSRQDASKTVKRAGIVTRKGNLASLFK